MRDDVRVEARAHWERIYRERSPDEVSWFEATPRTSLELIEEAGIDREAPVIDVGGGASHLAGELLHRGYADVTVSDISPASIEAGREALGARAGEVSWIEGDVREQDFGRRFALWHDRAVFHFMVEPAEREAYLATMRRSLAPDGQLIIATFGPEAPPSCSGLPVHRYEASELAALLPEFELAASRYEAHLTPRGKEQQFLYGRFVPV